MSEQMIKKIQEDIATSTKMIFEVHRVKLEELCAIASEAALLRVEVEKFKALETAAEKIRHWHDSLNGGMIVSGNSVRELWGALSELRKARS